MNNTLSPDIEHENQGETITIFTPVKVTMVMARISWIFLLGSLLSATVLYLIGLVVEKLNIAVENNGRKAIQTIIVNCDM